MIQDVVREEVGQIFQDLAVDPNDSDVDAARAEMLRELMNSEADADVCLALHG